LACLRSAHESHVCIASGRSTGRRGAGERRRPLGQREGNLAVKWLAGALVVLAAAIVAAALIIANSAATVNVHVDGPVTVCHTVSLSYANTC
jgi:hypothetical protein